MLPAPPDDFKIQPKGMVKNMLYLQQTNDNQTLTQWEYHAISEICSHPDYGEYISYGIQAFQQEHGRLHLIAMIHDISTKSSFVEELAHFFTLHQLSPLHFQEAVEDSIP